MSTFSSLLRNVKTRKPLPLPFPTETHHTKIPLRILFEEAVGLRQATETASSKPQNQSNEISQKLLQLESEVRSLNQRTPPKRDKPEWPERLKSLSAMFKRETGEKEEHEEEKMVFKELSPVMEVFVHHLYKEGYFNDANFLRAGRLDFSCFDDRYGREFIKFAVEKFGKDRQDIAMWLSGRDLKKVAQFGCPSLTRKNVFSAKRLRQYFKIKENTVCSKCVLQQSCKFANQNIWNGDTKNLNLSVALRIVTLYALEAVHPKLSVPEEIKASVSRVLHETIRLSQTTT